ncbi:6,7-dimethyl-8-ribityllumazine synthase [Legionella israelensis]|uniref:6,7-dimethyl-8-ribityllumazine synthase n=1 Tax=Legionella israelensis TaxID=454 RepID=UPI002467F3E1|nr:6,7-dimethyl-8-ribityllumazine synthase [Legionella israelensis]
MQNTSFPIAVIVSRFNQPVTEALKQGALQRLSEKGIHSEDIILIEVPGAVEIPLVAKKLAQQNEIKAIIALGAVIRGETSHYDYVCSQVSEGCQRVMLDYEIPVIFGILTTENEEQAQERAGGIHGHKGVDAVDCALEMASIMSQIE